MSGFKQGALSLDNKQTVILPTNDGDLTISVVNGELKVTNINNVSNSIISSDNIVFVNSKNDLPSSIGGVISLEDNKTYYITQVVDLSGDRLVTGTNTCILGSSSENCKITSTGLTGTLLTSNDTLILRYLTLESGETATTLSISGDLLQNPNTTFDWVGVNFLNCDNIGTVNSIDNFIYDTGAFLNSEGLIFTGDMGTVAFNNSIFVGGEVDPIISFDENANVSRRARFNTCAFVTSVSGNAIYFDENATIDSERYIIDTCSFGGPPISGSRVSGLQFDNLKSNFSRNTGINNSSSIANIYSKNNEAVTPIAAIGQRVSAVYGDLTVGSTFVERFELNENSTYNLNPTGTISNVKTIKYLSNITKRFTVHCNFTVFTNSPNADILGIYLAVNRDPLSNLSESDRISESEVYLTLSSGVRPDPGYVQTVLDLNEGDRVYLIVQNRDAARNIIVQFVNMIIQRAAD